MTNEEAMNNDLISREYLLNQLADRARSARNWNNTKIQSFILCHTCLRNIEENELLGYKEADMRESEEDNENR